MVWSGKESSRIRDLQMGNIRNLLSIRIQSIHSEWVTELCVLKKMVDERVVRWYDIWKGLLKL